MRKVLATNTLHTVQRAWRFWDADGTIYNKMDIYIQTKGLLKHISCPYSILSVKPGDPASKNHPYYEIGYNEIERLIGDTLTSMERMSIDEQLGFPVETLKSDMLIKVKMDISTKRIERNSGLNVRISDAIAESFVEELFEGLEVLFKEPLTDGLVKVISTRITDMIKLYQGEYKVYKQGSGFYPFENRSLPVVDVIVLDRVKDVVKATLTHNKEYYFKDVTKESFATLVKGVNKNINRDLDEIYKVVSSHQFDKIDKAVNLMCVVIASKILTTKWGLPNKVFDVYNLDREVDDAFKSKDMQVAYKGLLKALAIEDISATKELGMHIKGKSFYYDMLDNLPIDHIGKVVVEKGKE